MRIEVRLFGHISDAALEGGEIVVYASSLIKDLAGGGIDHAGEHLHGRALPGSVRSEISENFAGLNCKADVTHGGCVVVVFRERTRL